MTRLSPSSTAEKCYAFKQQELFRKDENMQPFRESSSGFRHLPHANCIIAQHWKQLECDSIRKRRGHSNVFQIKVEAAKCTSKWTVFKDAISKDTEERAHSLSRSRVELTFTSTAHFESYSIQNIKDSKDGSSVERYFCSP